MVTLAEMADIPEMEAMSKRFFDQNDYTNDKGYVYHTPHIIDAITRFVVTDTCIVTKYVNGGAIQGYMIVNIPAWSHLDSQPKTAFEMVWHGDPSLGSLKEGKIMLSLVDDMIDRLKDRVKGFQISASQPSVLRALERRGFKQSTVVMSRRFNHG